MKREELPRRLENALRAVPRTLREDLLSPGAYQRPRRPDREQSGWSDWRPALMVPLILFTVVVFIINVNMYGFRYNMGVPVGLLLAGVQAAAAIAVLYRPIPAWWASTLAMLLASWLAQVWGNAGVFRPWDGPTLPMDAGWSPTNLATQTLVLFLLALRVRPRIAAEALAISLLAGVFDNAFLVRWENTEFGLAAVLFSAAVVVGASLRGRRVARTQLVVQEEITADERARRTLLEERNRIARELHDVVAHHMSVISIQAQVAPHLVDNPPPELMENLAGIRQNAVEALTELRRVLGVLRSEDPLAEGVRNAPQPTLDRLGELVGNVRGAGVDVSTETTGTVRALSPGVELSAFRIVQEGLSNAMRHAPGAAVRVQLAHQPGSLTVRITNSAPQRPAAPSPGAGHGLLGMRERTAMLGGELATGPTPDGGYEVLAVLPLEDNE
ncbi:sensor histidine kinase [Streptacidiphilus sp. EB129]|uniref:sensor histidine kinase n=1 Tax=Streptacidiphilus sp. EB129 TaxID=3156262 RepID=UPI0035117EC2